jgi:hypothetical protein
VSTIAQLYNQVSGLLNTNPNLKRSVQTHLVSIVSNASIQAMNSDQGYCFKFILRLKSYKQILQLVNITERDLLTAFTKEWGSSAMSNRMHADPYYQTFNFFLYLGIKDNDSKIAESALSAVLYKLWNGRKVKFLQYCNKDIMNYVTNYMCNKKHLANKHATPFELIQNHFVPTLLEKYGNEVRSNSTNLKKLFEQAFSRIRQLFVSRNRIDIQTGSTVSDGGLLPLYTKAHKEGLSMSKVSIHANEDGETSFSDFTTASNLDEIITGTVEKIVMNPNPNYSNMFIDNLRQEYKIKRDVIIKFLKQLHNYKYHDQLHDIYSVLLKQTRVMIKDDICKPSFIEMVKKNVTSSKNNVDSVQLSKMLMILSEDILKVVVNRSISEYSTVYQIQIKKMVVRILIYNLKQNVCR